MVHCLEVSIPDCCDCAMHGLYDIWQKRGTWYLPQFVLDVVPGLVLVMVATLGDQFDVPQVVLFSQPFA